MRRSQMLGARRGLTAAVMALILGCGLGFSSEQARSQPAQTETADETGTPADAAKPVISILGYWPVERVLPRPELGDLDTIRFITEADYPPFHYLDSTGTLVGFNIDVAWGICTALKVRCTVRRVPWEKMAEELENGKADAAIASHRISAANRLNFHFTERYYDTPARFVMRKESGIGEPSPKSLTGQAVAVLKGTAHEAYLRTFFPKADIQVFDNRLVAREALRTGKVSALFGDGIVLSFWLDGQSSRKCCRFFGGPYTEPKYFGNGIGIAVKKGNYPLAHILNYGLDQVRTLGLFVKLYRRHFPQALIAPGS